MLVRLRIQDSRIMHGAALVGAQPRFGFLDTGREILRVVLREADTLVLLCIGQARVDRQRKRRIARLRIARVEAVLSPGSLERQQQPFARRRPERFVRKDTERREQVSVLFERIARDERGRSALLPVRACPSGLAPRSSTR